MCKRGEVYFVALPERQNKDKQGSIQFGVRPFIITQNNIGNEKSSTLHGYPMTKIIKNIYQPTHIVLPKKVGLEYDSMILFEQPFTINKFDIRSDLICSLSDEYMKKVDVAIRVSQGIKEQPDEEYILSIVRDINQLDSKISNNAKENKMMLEGVKIGFIRVLERYCNKFNVDYKNYIRNESVKETQNTIKLAV